MYIFGRMATSKSVHAYHFTTYLLRHRHVLTILRHVLLRHDYVLTILRRVFLRHVVLVVLHVLYVLYVALVLRPLIMSISRLFPHLRVRKRRRLMVDTVYVRLARDVKLVIWDHINIVITSNTWCIIVRYTCFPNVIVVRWFYVGISRSMFMNMNIG
jgi:hypothetical protein